MVRGRWWAILAVTALVAPAGAAERARADAVGDVHPLMGTEPGAPDFGTGGGAGGTFPGAVLPFGLASFSPDTTPTAGNPAGGYTASDRRLHGFSLTHYSGAGCASLQDVPLLPTTVAVRRSPALPGSSDRLPAYVPRFDHAHESASPGDYRVTLDPGTPRAIRAELTATLRTAVGRFTYPPAGTPTMLVDAGGSAMANGDAAVRIDPGAREVSGTAESGAFCVQPARYRVFFAARFSRGFASFGTWRRQAVGRGSRAAHDAVEHPINYKPIPGGPLELPGNPSTSAQTGAWVSFARGRRAQSVEVRVGVSFTSVAQARGNLRAEAQGRRFAALRSRARATWRDALGRARVHGGLARDRATFATSLYHALIEPSTISDADGRYRGMDGRLHRARGWTKLGDVSGWDVYRGQVQLMAMLFPRRASDLARSLLADAAQSGCLPRWPLATMQTNIMVGDPADPIIAGVHAFGARGFDARAALRTMVRGAERPCHTAGGDYTQREALAEAERIGYVPQDLAVDVTGHTIGRRDRPWGPAATTLEYATADWAISRLAHRLGDAATSTAFARRARRWRKLVNPATRAIEPRLADGSFLPDYDPASGIGFVEGNGAQYAWAVPHDPLGLAATMGGRAAALRRLDRLFTHLNAGPHAPFAYLGNEPGLGTPWLYDWLGRPSGTQRVVRRALVELYRPTPGGMPGNDDGGTMSAWWVLGALGFYPAVPGDEVLALGSPLFPRAVLRLPRGRLVVDAPRAARSRPYVRAMALDGHAVTRPWLRWRDLSGGGVLRVALSAAPDRSWGAAPADAPPSQSRPRGG
jgi:predicted alpha-1,2-mannosidase